MKRSRGILLAAVVVSPTVWAGGSSAPVVIESLKVRGVGYTLVVAPTALDKEDPYIGSCARFTVHGTYRHLNGAFLSQPEMLSKDNHLAALAYLQAALRNHQTVNLGWIGSGFARVDDADPCVVRSRALLLMEDERGRAVLSFYSAI